jgi:hypothetical protein
MAKSRIGSSSGIGGILAQGHSEGGCDDASNEDRLRLHGRPLASRSGFLIRRSILVLLYLALLGVALYGAIHLENLFFKGIGLALLALLAAVVVEVLGEGLFYLRKTFDYGRYRQEWERANEPENRVV